MSTENWTKDGNDYNRVILEASAIGHDLNRGTTQFTKRNAETAKNGQTKDSNQSQNEKIERTDSHSDSTDDEYGGDADI